MESNSKVRNRQRLHVAATAFLSLFSLVGISFYGLPFFYDYWVKDFGWTRATVISGNAFGKVIVGPVFGFFAGWLIDRFGPRRLMLGGILLGACALVGLGAMTSLWQFYLCYVLVAIGYVAGGPLPNQVLTSRWFDKSRGKAMGFAYLGIGFGGMLVPQIAKLLNLRLGWRSALAVLAAVIVVVAVPMVWFVKENPPGDSVQAEEAQVPISSILRSPSFYLLAIGSMCSIGAVGGANQNLKLFFSIDLKFSQEASANVFSLVLGASIIGRVLMGWLADRLSRKVVMMIIYALVALSIPLLYAASSPGVIYLFAVVFGIALGGDYMIIPLMAADLFGLRVMGRVMGIILTADGVAEAVGPLLVGWIRDRSGSYANGFLALIALAICGTIAVAFLPVGRAKVSEGR